jgi:alpha-mannosidase
MSSTHSFFDEVLRPKPRIPTVRGELNFIFDGCYTTHGDIKRYNRKCERLLVDAEKMSAFASIDRRLQLSEAWRNVLFNQFHDILDGSAVGDTYVHSAGLARRAMETAKSVMDESLKKIAADIKISRDGVPIVVFNSLSWERKDVVKVEIPRELIPEDPCVVDSEGTMSPAQADGSSVLFVADVPSLGYSTYYLVGGNKDGRTLVSDSLVLENETLRVELDKDSGAIATLRDKRNNRTVIKATRDEATMPVPSNLFQVLYEVPHGMSAWVIGKIAKVENLVRGASVEVLDRGPVRGRVRVSHKVGNSRISQDVTIYRDIPRVDFDTTIDWAEVGDETVDSPMLKVSFTPLLGESKATFEIPFGHTVRVADGREVPALRWVDVSDDHYGLSLLNDCKHGFDVNGGTMRMTLIRSSYNPDPSPDQGRHELLYSLYPHKGDWKEGLAFRKGYEINHPLEALVASKDKSELRSLPEKLSFVSVEPSNIVVSCVKLAEDSDHVILRIYDATGDGGKAVIRLGFQASDVAETDLMEREVSKVKSRHGCVRLGLRPNDIRTLKIAKSATQWRVRGRE